jgi:hypothetical protein
MANADLEKKSLTPLNVSASINGDHWLCALLQTQVSVVLFPILRMPSNWEIQRQQFYTETEQAVLYTIATLYLAASLIGIFCILYAIIKLPLATVFLTTQAVVINFTLWFVISKY